MKRICAHCEETPIPYSGTGRPRVFCSACLKKRRAAYDKMHHAKPHIRAKLKIYRQRNREHIKGQWKEYYYNRKLRSAAKEEAVATGRPVETILKEWGADPSLCHNLTAGRASA